MNSKRSHEGYYMIDNRESPGVPDKIMVASGLPAGSGKGLYETSCFTCSHCERIVENGPLRTRPRSWCKKCDHYLCDKCGAQYYLTGICYPFKAMVADLLNELDKKPQSEVFQSPVIVIP